MAETNPLLANVPRQNHISAMSADDKPLGARQSWCESQAAERSSLATKCRERGIEPTPDAFDDPDVRARAEADYGTLAQELPEGALPPFGESFNAVATFYRSLPWNLR